MGVLVKHQTEASKAASFPRFIFSFVSLPSLDFDGGFQTEKRAAQVFPASAASSSLSVPEGAHTGAGPLVGPVRFY